MGILATFGNEGWVKFYRLRKFEQSLVEKNGKIAQSSFSLRQEIEDLKDTHLVERYIRNVLGFVRDDEIIYEIRTTETSKGDLQ